MYDQDLLRNGLKRCARQHSDGGVLPLSQFGFDKTRPDGREKYCKGCRKRPKLSKNEKLKRLINEIYNISDKPSVWALCEKADLLL